MCLGAHSQSFWSTVVKCVGQTTGQTAWSNIRSNAQVWGPTRDVAIERMRAALAATQLKGAPNNLEFLKVSYISTLK